MAYALERFFNWQMDMDWSWGPLLPLRPARNVRMTSLFWAKLFSVCILLSVLVGAPLGVLLGYYDYTSAQHHAKKIAPVVAAETWAGGIPPGTVLFCCSAAIAFAFLYCFPTHWAWNRRTDRLNREASLLQPQLFSVIDASVWPPPPAAPEKH